ncbi:MAG TPA: hypothetical protein VKT72_05740 [Candidatus Baltobacteraceae bacterium]|nr:hypothetical protein [Candidatus Baltobacteraceae bacterium]
MATLRTFLRPAAIAVFSATMAACGGQSAFTPSLSSGAAPHAQVLAATSSSEPAAITVSGSVISADVYKFTVKTTSPSCGTMYFYYSEASTKFYPYLGYPVTAGMPIQAYGSGTCANGGSIQASTITYTAAATPPPPPAASSTPVPSPAPSESPASTVGGSGTMTLTGNVVSADIYKFTVRTTSPSCGTMYVYYNKASTSFHPYLGYPVTVGMPIQATGSGACANAGSMQATTITYTGAATPSPSSAPTIAPTAVPTAAPSPVPTVTPVSGTYTPPPTTAFMPSSWGAISAFQVFDDTSNGYIPESATAQDGWRYSTIWGARDNIGRSWLDSNPSLETGYYGALETDESYASWGSVGHTLSWWQANHPDWILYACTSSGSVTTTPAWVPGLSTNVPLDVHNPAVVDYQVRTMANEAHALGYAALAVDEATFWQADEGAGSGSYGCGVYENGSFVRRYWGASDPNWAADVVAWVQQAHAILKTDPLISTYHLKLIVNHPPNLLTSNETTFLANVDADLDETGYSGYGNYANTAFASVFVVTTNWSAYAQQHGVAVLMNDNWGSLPLTAPRLDYSIATYLMGNQQAESLFASSAWGYGLEQWHSQYQTAVGAPCAAYYGGPSYDPSNPSIYYRRFANAVVVVNGGSGSASEAAHLPTDHTYADLLGRPVSNPLTIASNDGYVLLTSNGCQ